MGRENLDRQAADRNEFAARLRLQIQARYHGVDVAVDGERFCLHVTGSGIDETLPLSPLLHACERDPGQTAALISDFVRRTAEQLTPRSGTEFSLGRILWCVRSNTYLRDMGRRDELLRQELGGGLTAFVAEALPGSVMRGLPRSAWRDGGIDDDVVRAASDSNTAERFAGLIPRIATTDRIPADGWRLSSDTLFQGSVLLVREVLTALVTRAGCEILLANPDRGLVLALPSNLAAARSFPIRTAREWREAMNPASREVFVSDGAAVRALPRKGSVVMPWIAE